MKKHVKLKTKRLSKAQRSMIGREAQQWGGDHAALVAERLGAERVGHSGNFYKYRGRYVLIKSSKTRPGKIKPTLNSLARVDRLLGVLRHGPTGWRAADVSAKWVQRLPSKSAGRAATVTAAMFEKHGKLLTVFELPLRRGRRPSRRHKSDKLVSMGSKGPA